MTVTLHAQLVALVLAVWAGMHVTPGDGLVIADAIATVIEADGPHAPVFGSHAEDAAVMAAYAVPESGVRLRPGHWVDPRTGKAVDPLAFGPWQTHRLPENATAADFARDWLAQLRAGKRTCPASPASPLSGSCHLARPVADRRVAGARQLLGQVLAAGR